MQIDEYRREWKTWVEADSSVAKYLQALEKAGATCEWVNPLEGLATPMRVSDGDGPPEEVFELPLFEVHLGDEVVTKRRALGESPDVTVRRALRDAYLKLSARGVIPPEPSDASR